MSNGELVLFKPFYDPNKDHKEIDSTNDFRDNWLKAACDLYGLVLYTFEDVHDGDLKLIHQNIINKTKNAQVVIADITGGSFNVYYELGLSHGLLLDRTIIVTNNSHDKLEKLPFDIKPYRVHSYNSLNTEFEYTKENIEENSDDFLKLLLKEIRIAKDNRRNYKIGIAEYPELLAMFNYTNEGKVNIDNDISLELIPVEWPRIKNELIREKITLAIYNKNLVEEANYLELTYIYYSNILRYNSFYIIGKNENSVKRYNDYNDLDPIERCKKILNQFSNPVIVYSAPNTDQKKIIDNLINYNKIQSEQPYGENIIKTSMEVSSDFINNSNNNVIFVGGINDKINLLRLKDEKGTPRFKLLFEGKRVKDKYPYFSQYNGMVFLFKDDYPSNFFKDIIKINKWLIDSFSDFRKIFFDKEIDLKKKLKEEDKEQLEEHLIHYNSRNELGITPNRFHENYILSKYIEIIK